MKLSNIEIRKLNDAIKMMSMARKTSLPSDKKIEAYRLQNKILLKRTLGANNITRL